MPQWQPGQWGPQRSTEGPTAPGQPTRGLFGLGIWPKVGGGTGADMTSFPVSSGEMDLPTFLGINSSMSPLQQRTRLATLATTGGFAAMPRASQGPYAGMGAGDVARDYYKYIALKSLTDASGNALSEGQIAPVEWDYLTQVLGKSRQGDSLAHFLTLLTS